MIQIDKLITQAPFDIKKADAEVETQSNAREIGDLHHIMYAQKKFSLLVILQGMDASGKDGTSRAVFQECTPGTINVYGFKKPTPKELGHDFMWRVHQQSPEKGFIQVFNRSHYEDILIQRVHNWIDMDRVKKRMNAINVFEELLQFDNNTIVLKFFLNISNERQKVKLQERMDNPKKQWKHNDQDWNEREYWPQYMEAYEYAINNSVIPWHIIPADASWYRNLLVSRIVLNTLQSLDLRLPALDTNLR
jgi:PPK2 family polyphosphate:nucleotide phosphotransferase